jgi:hypothetical protein|tara:strand:+ start:543 stop:791 length:249 start_codon:yes stop_codon:yes gene_type:complete
MNEIKPEHCYTKQEVDRLIEKAIEDAIRKHNRNASLISMCLGIIFIALFAEGFFRVIGMIPPFMGIDVSLIKDIVEKVREAL